MAFICAVGADIKPGVDDVSVQWELIPSRALMAFICGVGADIKPGVDDVSV
jgi:hypothetical protein